MIQRQCGSTLTLLSHNLQYRYRKRHRTCNRSDRTGDGLTAQATGETTADATNSAPTNTETIGSGLRDVPPVKDSTTSLTGQHALNVALLPLSDWPDCHPKAIECARVLKVALTFIQRDPTLPVSEEIRAAL